MKLLWNWLKDLWHHLTDPRCLPHDHVEKYTKYNFPYDSEYCEVCDVWLDGDENCTDYMFGTKRPEKPSEAMQWVER